MTKNNLGNLIRCTGVAALLLLVFAPAAWAHIDPDPNDGPGITILLNIYRNSTCTLPVAPQDVLSCEGIFVQATLASVPGRAAFEAGRWRFTSQSLINVPPGNTEGEFGPANICTAAGCTATGFTPCVGGTANDDNVPPVNGRGQCLGSPTIITSDCIPYTISAADVTAGGFVITSRWGDVNIPADPDTGYTHRAAGDIAGAAAAISDTRIVSVCPTGDCAGLCLNNGDAPATCPFIANSTACPDTDGNVCTVAGCPGTSILCNQNHTLLTSVTAGCNETDGNVCTEAGCRIAAGTSTCVQDHILRDSIPCPDTGNPCNVAGCDGATGLCDQDHILLSSVTAGCDDTDGNVCREPGCRIAGGTSTCVQDHVLRDSIPCPDTDTNPCNVPGCDGATGLCNQTHRCEPAGKPACEALVSDCVWRDTNGVEACQDAGDGANPSGLCPGGISGVPVSLIRCSSGGVVDTDTTGAGGIYSLTATAVNAACVPTAENFQVRFGDLGTFVTPDSCLNDTTDSDCVEQADGTGLTGCLSVDPGTDTTTVDCGGQGGVCDCLVVIDEEGLDNDFRSVEHFAGIHGVTPDFLINDDRPTEGANPWLRWNELFPGDIVKLPTGQVKDEGWYMLPTEADFFAATGFTRQQFVDGVIPQSALDKIPDVMPLRNQELAALVGTTCVAIVYDSDISINYNPLLGNLQGARLGKFAFTLLAVETPGSLPSSNGNPSDPFPNTLPESKSSTSLYDVWLEVLAPRQNDLCEPTATVIETEPDSCEIVRARVSGGQLTVIGKTSLSGAVMTFSVDGPDRGGSHTIPPAYLEAPMTLVPGETKRFTATVANGSLIGRRISIQTDLGCAYNARVK